ncbi:MAG: hypothetical protein HYW89_04330 [Candidatus Sungiibacteriota bacterium]|uniref:nicotinate phosphoribosyltransferase n=1 Tax=Candidatus Sungiibacteriota bacterium TaxID=2750080 RepID=A0A7T5UQI0_9BACT|nr:MAG: hypothetical protein HYW89_04330 [Candidatus Sungbacteria bacterium]
MLEAQLIFDRYHATMDQFASGEHALIGGKPLADLPATFYVSQRKLSFAPCVGHERLLEGLMRRNIDVPRARFLREDKAGLSRTAERLASTSNPFLIRCVKPGTIMFAREPFADITGPFAETQMMEVRFEHAFDEPMTVAGRALAIRLDAGERWISDFSLRRDGSLGRAVDIAKYSYIGGFDDTSNMEAAFLLDINAVGTMAHYLVQAFLVSSRYPQRSEKGVRKHFQQACFEQWLDAHPKGTTLLLDTITLRLGVIHTIRAAKSSEGRRGALRAVRIDSGNLIKNALWVRAMLDANALEDVKIILTSDLDRNLIAEIVKRCPAVYGFGVGTKLAAEVENVAGVIFKLSQIDDLPTLKCSETPGKETLPGRLQVWRCIDHEGFFVKDVIGTDGWAASEQDRKEFSSAFPLLQPWWGNAFKTDFLPYEQPRMPTIQEQRVFVQQQVKRFRDIHNYPVELSSLTKERIRYLTEMMTRDEMGESGVVMVDYPS